MSEQDDPDVIEHDSRRISLPRIPWIPWRPTGKKPAILAVAGSLTVLKLTSGNPADPDLAALITAVTTVPAGKPVPVPASTALPTAPPLPSSGSPAYSSTLLIEPDVPVSVKGPPLVMAGKPEVLYVGTEYCPYCAAESWALVVALSHFGLSCSVWQVLGSNQRRLSRRFYRPLLFRPGNAPLTST